MQAQSLPRVFEPGLGSGRLFGFYPFRNSLSRSRAAAAAQPIQKTQKLPSRGPVRANGVLQ